MERWVLFLIVVFALALVVYPQFSKVSFTEIDKEKALMFVKEDIIHSYPNSLIRFVSAEESNGVWRVSAKITLDAGKACPTVYVRDYELMPIRFKEKTLIKNCVVSGPIFLEEEALVISGKLPEVQRILGEGGSGSASFYYSDRVKELQSTSSDLGKFLVGLDAKNVWIVDWVSSSSRVLVALSEDGKVIKSEKIS